MKNRFKIEVGESTRTTKIELNGTRLEGVCSVNFDLSANRETVLTLKIAGEVLVEGEFRDDAILHVRQTLSRQRIPT